MSKYIITGGPGAGKTSLLEGLRHWQYTCHTEASRQLIIEEKEIGSGCLPWLDLSCFAKKVLQRMTADFEASDNNIGPVFFDRGIPDIIAYLEAAGLPVENVYYSALKKFRYAPTVFMLPPWQEIYVQDSERWQTFTEAQRLAEHLRIVYRHNGYHIIELPFGTVEERVKFIQDALCATAQKEKHIS